MSEKLFEPDFEVLVDTRTNGDPNAELMGGPITNAIIGCHGDEPGVFVTNCNCDPDPEK